MVRRLGKLNWRGRACCEIGNRWWGSGIDGKERCFVGYNGVGLDGAWEEKKGLLASGQGCEFKILHGP